MNLQEAVDRERWRLNDAIVHNGPKFIRAVCVEEINGHNEALDRISESANKPRVMRRWEGRCKPKKSGLYWIRDLDGAIRVDFVSTYAINKYGKDYYTHWLELESMPVLPEGEA